eukprot:Phypoly_transcript_19444.p1 GENE.Phypoly_transcript_19444~~Phypoly_transcript_19444.p1  ORF type:complete len:176 (-),score=30.19 Phypoly_transcript_19444:87-614(-)
MQGQDWETYQFRKKEAKPKGPNAADAARQKGMAVETHKKYAAGTNSNHVGPAVSAKKLEDEDAEIKVPKVDRNVAAAIARGRAAKELNQKEFAVKINEPVKTVVDYEQGKAIPSQPILAKMERVLGIKLVCGVLLSFNLAFILECIALSIHSHPTCLYFIIISLLFHFHFLFFYT